ncbi:MAG: S1 RNA-binding domain-containing protein, partial [Alphaproteobacteria bacterium]|nr:S1 RNA-binding domain-containing protein [Alphaproteobacteria bacterium]
LVHISELADHRVDKVTDIIQEGSAVKAKLIGIDDRGKVKLSVRMVDQETGEDISDQVKPKGDRARN